MAALLVLLIMGAHAALDGCPVIPERAANLQVGYGKRPGPGVSTRRRASDNARSNLASDSNAAKQRLKQAMTSSTRRDGASGDDALKLVLGFTE